MKNADLHKKFGATNITRFMFEYAFGDPIDMDYVSDESMEILADAVESYIKTKYPEVADELFTIITNRDLRDKPEYSEPNETLKEAWDEYMLAMSKMAATMGGIVWKDGYAKQFGASHITREMFKDCFSKPIDMSNVPDEGMVALAINVENYMRDTYPGIVDKLFAVWVDDDSTDKDQEMVATYRGGKMWKDYWDTLEDFAIQAGGVVCAADSNH
jgi:hypothetical protein